MFAVAGPDIPAEVLAASGRAAPPLVLDIDKPTPQADRWLESKFPRWTRALLEDWATGALDHLEGVIFSRADDSSQRLYYYACELQRLGQIGGPRPLLFDMAKIGRATSEEQTAAAVRRLCDALGVGAGALAAVQTPPAARVAAAGRARTCLLDGSLPVDRRIHAMIEAAGWLAAGPTLTEAWHGPVEALGVTDDPFLAVARRLRARNDGPRGFRDEGAAVVHSVREAGAAAVVLWFVEEEEALVWTLPARRAALEAAGTPALVLTRRDARGNDGAAAEIREWLEGLA